MPLKLHHSNRLELLFDAFAEIIATPLSSPFKPEIIVVHSKGMERWLSMEIAKRFGVCANCTFFFPENFTREMFRCVLGEIADLDFFSPSRLSWLLMDILSGLKEEPGFEEIKYYLSDDETQLKTFQLSEKIANLFDSYTIYRPEMIFNWSKKPVKEWQQVLWGHIIRGNEEKNRVHILYRFLEEIKREGINIQKNLPERVSIFGISTLPVYYLKVIEALSSIVDIHLFFLNPTCEFWAYIVPEKRVKKSPSDYFEAGNSLLASMGRMGRDFFNAILEISDEEFEFFDRPHEYNLLTAIQSDIFYLRQRGRDIPETSISDEDISVQIHSCHSPLREIEVLYNNLLYLFEKFPDLKPKDIIVMTPDIESYAPYISAVFDTYQNEKERIPYSIADRKASNENPVVSLFIKILTLCTSRFYASDVVDILDDELIREKFKLKEKDMGSILKWIKDTNIRWGIDKTHREFFNNPPFIENSWQAGIEKLLLGYAIYKKDEELYKGILPYSEMEGDEVDTLERLLDFLLPLFDFTKKIMKTYTLDEWADIIGGIIETFIIVNDETERYVQFIREKILSLKKIKALYSFDKKISFHVILYYLKSQLSTSEFTGGFITGGVTFCEMLPMRSIPFKVVALIGMNNDTFPREFRPLGFDLIAQNPKRGDRSLRDEDRYIFLEAILSARLCLYISYTGQSIKDGSPIPPSVVVSELLDYIDKGFSHPGKPVSSVIVKNHPLQGFSKKYFEKGTPIINYSLEDYETVKSKIESKYLSRPFILKPLKGSSMEITSITNSDLKNFYSHPIRYFFNNTLGIYLDDVDVPKDDSEPLELTHLERFRIKTKITSHLVSQRDIEKTKEVIYAEGAVPPMSVGRVTLENIGFQAEKFFRKIKEFIKERKERVIFDFYLENYRIEVKLEDIYDYGLVRYRCAKDIRARYLMETWIDHIFYNIFCGGNGRSVFLSLKKTYQFRPLNNPEELLERLIRIYTEAQRYPVRLFPETSFAYVEALKKKGHEYALNVAKERWERDTLYEKSEGSDPYHYACFREKDPMDDMFFRYSTEVFEPLIEAIWNE